MSSQNHDIIVNRQGRVLRLTLNRPKKRNAMSAEMYRALTHSLKEAQSDNTIHVVLISAKGSCFCAGNDIDSFDSIKDIPYQQRPGYNFMQTLASFPKPVVAAVKGNAVGIGATLLLHCDLVYLSENCHLKYPFTQLGIVPEFASTTLLPLLLGQQKSAEILLMGNHLPAEKAVQWGLANAAMNEDVLCDYVLKVCNNLANLPLKAIMLTKQLMKQPNLSGTLEKIEQETLAINQLLPNLALTTKGKQEP